MEQRAQPKKRYLSASYLTGRAVFYGTLLFFIARVFELFQLFGDAYNRKQLDQAPPDGFTFLGIVGSLLVIGVIGLAFLLLVQNRQKKLRLKKGNFYLLLNVLYVIWGAINAVNNLVDMIVFFEFVYLLDFIALITALIVPSVLLQLTDRSQGIPRDSALFASAITALSLSILATLIVVIFLRGGYKDTPFALVRELIFRAGMLCFSVAGLVKALKIRAELPEIVDAVVKAAAKAKAEQKTAASKQTASSPKQKTTPSGKIECPDCGKKVDAETRICPRCGFDLTTPSLFDDEDETFEPDAAMYDEPEEEPEEEAEVPAPAPEPEAPPIRNDICARCGKHKPPFLSTCPHCGYFPGDPAAQESERPSESRSQSVIQQTEPGAEQKKERFCEHCGKRIPGGLATCPYCGFHPADARRPQEPPESVPDKLFDEEEPEEETIFCPRCDYEVAKSTQVCPHCGYPFPDERQTGRIQRPTQRLPRVPDPIHLNEKNSIECPDCGRRYSAARDRCPYCGYGLYDD
ncbi:MAG: zinc ribbon domain-containing protein [Eubacteriales bacterium]|nr:zinc ribbon domain-containing protein [Eubacteriales bacterium]